MEIKKEIHEIAQYEKNGIQYLIGWDGCKVYFSHANERIWYDIIIPSPMVRANTEREAWEVGIAFIEKNDDI
jgi:hypothetical protein